MPIPKPPKAVTFDCWSTLISDTNWEKVMQRRREALVEIAQRNGVELTLDGAEKLIDAAWRQHMAAWRSGKKS
jgi:FMN phosphatase YigB (HAD superfamily)